MYCKCRSSRVHRRATDPKACARSSPHSIIAFLLTEGAWDNAEGWASLSASDRSTLKSQYAAAGISLMVSVFGSTDTPTSSGADPTDTANTFAAWVQEYDLDGIDVDYEVCLLWTRRPPCVGRSPESGRRSVTTMALT